MPVSPYTLSREQQQALLWLAAQSIQQGLLLGQRWRPSLRVTDTLLAAHGCSFVTLHKVQSSVLAESSGAADNPAPLNLRGCIGGLSVEQPLWQDVVTHAYDAAFHDPRFPPVQREELPSVQLEVSVLSPLQPQVETEYAHLCAMLRPRVDGVILQQGARRAVFLPQVWEQLPEPEMFLTALLSKGGWPSHRWPEHISVDLFQVSHCQAAFAKCLTAAHHGVGDG